LIANTVAHFGGAGAAAKEIAVQNAKDNLLREKQPMLQFSNLNRLGRSLCFCAVRQPGPSPPSIDGGWVALW
jgi:hypothetical protein